MHSEYRLTLPFQTIETATPMAKAALEKVKAQLGFIPNMYAGMANSPGLLDTYMVGYDRFRKDSGFTPSEQEVAFLTISRTNGCNYCVAAHSVIADKSSRVPLPVTEAIRDGRPIPEAKLAALSAFTAALLATRGLPSRVQVETFLAAGYEERQVLELILAIAVKTLSNYSNHLFHTALDAVFAGRKWSDRDPDEGERHAA